MLVVDSAMPDMTAWTGRNLVWNLSEPQDVRCGARSNRKGPTCVRRASDEQRPHRRAQPSPHVRRTPHRSPSREPLEVDRSRCDLPHVGAGRITHRLAHGQPTRPASDL